MSQREAERPDPEDDPFVCSRCGVFLGCGPQGSEYCDSCRREFDREHCWASCHGCGREASTEHMEAIDISPADEYYPEIVHVCRDCQGGDSG